jgi:phage shock protein E
MYRFLSLLLVFGSLGACAQEKGEANINLNVTEVSELIAANPKLVLIDVRTPEEFAQGHLKEAQLLNFYDANFKEEAAKLDPEMEYVVYCRSGGRSAKATAMLQELGFGMVHNMSGGIMAWNRADLQTEQ